jgi:hypothetical protein
MLGERVIGNILGNKPKNDKYSMNNTLKNKRKTSELIFKAGSEVHGDAYYVDEKGNAYVGPLDGEYAYLER